MTKTLSTALLFVVIMVGAWGLLRFGSELQSSGNTDSVVTDPSIQDSGGMTSAEVPEGDAAAKLTRTDAGEGAVTLSATLITEEVLAADSSISRPDYDSEKEIVFLVALNTHSVELSGYDLPTITTMNVGGKDVKAIGEWQSVSESGHHRSGYLRFPRIIDDQDVIAGSGSLELAVKGVADISERLLTWPLPLEQN